METTLEQQILGAFLYDIDELKKYASKIDRKWFIESTGVITNRTIFDYLVNHLQGGYDAFSVSEAFNSDANILAIANEARQWFTQREMQIAVNQLAAKRLSVEAKNLIASIDESGDLDEFSQELVALLEKPMTWW